MSDRNNRPGASNPALDRLASTLVLGALLDELRRRYDGYDVVAHWQQGEFHHDVVLRVGDAAADLPGRVLLVATNCNGGVKEVLAFRELPERAALWELRCGHREDLPGLVGVSRTIHWFDPCELLRDDARSEYRAEFRRRQDGGGWELAIDGAASKGCGR